MKKTEAKTLTVIATRKANTGNKGVGLSHYVPMPTKKKKQS